MRIPKLCRTSDGRAYSTHPKTNGKKREYFGLYGSADADKKYRQWVARLVTNETPAVCPRSPTLNELALLYLDHAIAYYAKDASPTKEYFLVRDAVRVLLESHADILASRFGPPMLMQVQQRLVKKGYARGTVNRQISRIKRFVRWCCAMGYAPPELHTNLSAVDGIRKGRTDVKETQPVKPVPWCDVESVLPYVSPTVRGLIKVQFYCGMRPQDVVAMQETDIDTSRDIWLYTPQSHKTEHLGKTLVKAIPKTAQRIITPFLGHGYLFRPADSHRWHAQQRRQNRTRKTPLYPSEAKRRKNKPSRRLKPCYSVDSYRRAINHGFNQAKSSGNEIPHWHPHQLRHACSTEIAKTLGQQAAQRWLGHASLDTTSIYTEIEVSELLSIATQLDDLWD